MDTEDVEEEGKVFFYSYPEALKSEDGTTVGWMEKEISKHFRPFDNNGYQHDALPLQPLALAIPNVMSLASNQLIEASPLLPSFTSLAIGAEKSPSVILFPPSSCRPQPILTFITLKKAFS